MYMYIWKLYPGFGEQWTQSPECSTACRSSPDSFILILSLYLNNHNKYTFSNGK